MFNNSIFGSFIIAVVFTLSSVAELATASEGNVDIDKARQLVERSISGKVLSMKQTEPNAQGNSIRFTVLTDSGLVKVFTVNENNELVKKA
jgi:hypothetical protein